MSFINVAIGVGSAIYGGIQAKRQGDAAERAGKSMDPFGKYRKQYAEMLNKLMDDPSSFLENPLYKAAFGQGQQAVMRGFGPTGHIGSGNMATGLQSFGMGFANDMFNEAKKFLAHLAGADIGSNQGPALQAQDRSMDRMSGAFGELGGVLGMFGPGAGMGGSSPLPTGIIRQPGMGSPTVSAPNPGTWMPSGDFGL